MVCCFSCTLLLGTCLILRLVFSLCCLRVGVRVNCGLV